MTRLTRSGQSSLTRVTKPAVELIAEMTRNEQRDDTFEAFEPWICDKIKEIQETPSPVYVPEHSFPKIVYECSVRIL